MITHATVLAAHKFSLRQKLRYEADERVGCFHCEAVYFSGEIQDWCNELDGDGITALCAKCGIDSVISLSDVTQLEITESNFAELLHAMEKHWFGTGIWNE